MAVGARLAAQGGRSLLSRAQPAPHALDLSFGAQAPAPSAPPDPGTVPGAGYTDAGSGFTPAPFSGGGGGDYGPSDDGSGGDGTDDGSSSSAMFMQPAPTPTALPVDLMSPGAVAAGSASAAPIASGNPAVATAAAQQMTPGLVSPTSATAASAAVTSSLPKWLPYVAGGVVLLGAGYLLTRKRRRR